MKPRNTTIFRGRFSRLKLMAFGHQQTIEYEAEIEIYQARTSPELWRARPLFKSGNHVWEASTAADLMALIVGDFEDCITAWVEDSRCPVKSRPALRRLNGSAGDDPCRWCGMRPSEVQAGFKCCRSNTGVWVEPRAQKHA